MKFFRGGRKGDRERASRAKEQARDAAIDGAVTAVRRAMNEPHICLPMCVLLNRILAEVLPTVAYRLVLGSLHVLGNDDGSQDRLFDPRGLDGVDGGFHAWLEDARGSLVDPSILLTLASCGYDVDPNTYLLDGSRAFEHDGLTFVYQELPELDLVGVAESDAYLASLMDFALLRKPPPLPGTVYLDVVWRGTSSNGA